ncbi:MAG TPA: response regulator, partial [Gaiella sp.]
MTATRIMVADGRPSFRRSVVALLAARGFEVVGEAEDGPGAIALVSEVDPQVVLLDARLPDLDGFEVASQLLARHADLVVVLVSGHDRSSQVRPALADGVNAAAGFVNANESALATVQQVEARNRALLGAIPDTILRYGRDGTYLDARPDAYSAQLFPPEQFIGRNVREVLPDELARTIIAGIERALESGSMQVLEYEVVVRGEAHWREARIV